MSKSVGLQRIREDSMRRILYAIENPSKILPFLRTVLRGMKLKMKFKKYIDSTMPYHLEKLGIGYSGFIVPTNIITSDWICYCAGVGEDITFDLELIKRFSCSVFAFDPTPRVKTYVEKTAADNPRYHFYPIGLWSSTTKLKFYTPKDPSHVSHSILNLQRTSEFFEADCKRVSEIMKELGHDHIDLLKLDIEGAEYEVINSLIGDHIDIKVLCVEIHPVDPAPLKGMANLVKELIKWGYSLVSIDVQNFTFIKNNLA